MYDFNPETTRDLYLHGEVEEELVSDLIQKIDKINEWYRNYTTSIFNDLNGLGYGQYFQAPEVDPIVLHINSVGGSVWDGIALLNTMDASEVPIITMVDGYACSMGLSVLMKGDTRYAYKNSIIMFHHLSSSLYGDVETIKRNYDRMEALQKTMDDMTLEATCGLFPQEKMDYLRERCKDLYMDGIEAYNYGFVDFLIDADPNSILKQEEYDNSPPSSTDREFVDSEGTEYAIQIGDECKEAFLKRVLTSKQFTNIYEAFEDPFEFLGDYESLLSVKGFGSKSVEKLMNSFLEEFDVVD